MDEKQRLPENREAIATISRKVLTQVAPVQIDISESFIDSLVDMSAEDEVVEIERESDEAGGIGSEELLIMVIVPVVGKVLSEVLIKPIDKQALVQLIENTLNSIIDRTKSRQALKKKRQLSAAINQAFQNYCMGGSTNP